MVIAGVAGVVLLLAVVVSMALIVRPDSGPPPPGTRLALLAAIVAVAATVLGSLIWSSGFVWDDIADLRQAQVEPLSIEHLLTPTTGHIAPGHRLADWLFYRSFGFDFRPAAVILVLGFALTLLVFHRLLAELFGAGVGALALTLIYAVSITHVAVGQWWASGMDRLPATFFSFLAMLWYVRWFRTRAWRYVVASIVALALAEMFYIKPVFVPLYLLMLRVFVLEPQRRLRETAAGALREWRVWVAYGVTVIGFAIVYVHFYRRGEAPHTSAAELLQYGGTVWFRVLVPNLFGIWVPREDVPALGWVGVVAAQLLFVALVVWSIARWRAAWRAWAFFAIGFVVNTLVVVATWTIKVVGVRNLTYFRYYNLEATFLFAIALGAALLGPRGVPAVNGPPARSWSLASPAQRTLAAIGLVAYVGLSWWGGYRISQPDVWIGARSRAYLDAATADLHDLQRAGRSVALVDGVVSDDVAAYVETPYNSASEVFPLMDEHVNFDATRPELYDIGRDGRAHAVAFEPVYGGDILTLLQRQMVGVLSATPRLVANALCVTSGDEPASFVVLPSPPLRGNDLALRLEFAAGKASRLALVVYPTPVINEGVEKGRTKFRVVNVATGAGQVRVYALDAPLVETLAVVVGRHADLCVSRLEVGRLVPRS